MLFIAFRHIQWLIFLDFCFSFKMVQQQLLNLRLLSNHFLIITRILFQLVLNLTVDVSSNIYFDFLVLLLLNLAEIDSSVLFLVKKWFWEAGDVGHALQLALLLPLLISSFQHLIDLSLLQFDVTRLSVLNAAFKVDLSWDLLGFCVSVSVHGKAGVDSVYVVN